jgi:hypothetical protein
MGDRGPVIVTLAIGGALTILVYFALRARSGGTEASPTPSSASAEAGVVVQDPPAPPPLRRPPTAVAELALLSERPELELDRWRDPANVARLIGPRWCGEAAACDAVRATLEDTERTHIDVMSAWAFRLERIEVAEVAGGLSTKERRRLEGLVRAAGSDGGRPANVLIVNVTGPAFPEQLPARTAFAVAGALAERLDAMVYDELVDRVESARGFSAHAITSSLASSAFRRDSIDVQEMKRDDGSARLLTVGLARFGVPDVDVREAGESSLMVLRELLFEIAQALVEGEPVPIGLVNIDPENGDPNDFMARVVPPSGAFSADDYDELARELVEERDAGD